MSTVNKYALPFYGVGTAMITPMRNDAPDLAAVRRLTGMQIAGGIDALIVTGTTGEAATLLPDERTAVLEAVIETANGRVPIIAGTGSQDTRSAVRAAVDAKARGANAILVVTPYYNKGTAEGIVRHYESIADAADLPLILYNVPSRTGVNLSLDQLARLSEHPRIVAIKEASGDIGRIADITATLAGRLAVYGGNDAELLPTLSLGGIGLISVISNLYPEKTVAIHRLFAEGKTAEAARAATRLLPMIRLLFAETNPSPIKYAMAQTGLCTAEMRLPMTPPGNALCEKIKAEMKALENA